MREGGTRNAVLEKKNKQQYKFVPVPPPLPLVRVTHDVE
jgi:hypothetical protein